MEMLLQCLNEVQPMSEELTGYLKEHVQVKELPRKLVTQGRLCLPVYLLNLCWV